MRAYSFLTLLFILIAPVASASENLAEGKTYAFSVAPNYPLCSDDEDTRNLTDGATVKTPEGSSLWGQKGAVGWQHVRKPIAITVDLGQTQSISGVSLRSAAGASGVSFPSSILLQVSDDGKDFSTIGDLVRLDQSPPPPPYNVYAEHLYKTDALSARGRFVRFNVVPSSIFFFTDELQVFAGDQTGAPSQAAPSTEDEITDPLRLTQLGVYRRLRSDLEQVRSIVQKDVADGLKDKLLQTLSEIAQRVQKETFPSRLEGFRAVLPLNELHREIFAVYGQALASQNIEPLTLWHSDRYEMLSLFERPRDPVQNLSVRMVRNEHRAEVLNLSNASAAPRTATIRVENLPDNILRVFQVEYVDTRENTPVAAALVELTADNGAYTTTVPAGMTRQIWLSFNPTAAEHAGTHSGKARIQSGDFARDVDLSLSVSSLSVPETPGCAMGLWDYIADRAYGITDANADAARQTMLTHLATVPWCGPNSVPLPTAAVVDSEGNLQGKIDYTNWDKFIALWPDAKYFMAFAGFHENTALAGFPPGSSSYQRLVKQWAADWARHNRESLHLAPGRVMLLSLDEPGTESHFAATAQFSKSFREGSRDILIFVDPVGLNVHETKFAPEALELADIVSPTLGQYQAGPRELRGFYQRLRNDHRQLWFYMCSGPVRHFDPSYHRLQPWFAFSVGGAGSQFWALGDSGNADSWNEYAAVGGQTFTPLYLSRDSVHISKHWEAAREGIEDYEYLLMLQREIARLDPRSAEKAKQLLQRVQYDAFNRTVTDHARSNPSVFNNASTIAESLRLEILDLLDANRK